MKGNGISRKLIYSSFKLQAKRYLEKNYGILAQEVKIYLISSLSLSLFLKHIFLSFFLVHFPIFFIVKL